VRELRALVALLLSLALLTVVSAYAQGQVIYNATGVYIKIPLKESIALRGAIVTAEPISGGVKVKATALTDKAEDVHLEIYNSTGDLLATLDTDFASSSTWEVSVSTDEAYVVIQAYRLSDNAFLGVYAVEVRPAAGPFATLTGPSYIMLCMCLVAPGLAALVRARSGAGALGLVALSPACWALARLMGAPGTLADAMFAMSLIAGAIVFFASGRYSER